jgi:tRNA threonylcarbamoyladenosine biosynthesis protein TsaB
MTVPAILAIDTATELCSVAVLHGDAVVEHVEAVGQRHSERVLPLVDRTLAQAGVTLADIDAFAFGAGPGSFTGLRIACGVVQGLAYGCGRRVVAIGNLRAMAAQAFALQPQHGRALAAIDARMHEAYCGVYRNDDECLEERAPSLERPAALPAIARAAGARLVVGDALTVFADVWTGAGLDSLPALRASAGTIARLARIDLARGRAVDPAAAMPVYVRDRVAFTVEERRQRAPA